MFNIKNVRKARLRGEMQTFKIQLFKNDRKRSS